MKKIRSVVLVSVAVSLGAVVVSSCQSFSSTPGNAGGSGGSGPSGSGGSTAASGGSTVSSGGSTAASGGSTGSSGGSTGSGGSTVSSGGSTAASGGSTGSSGGSTGSGGSIAATGPCDVLAAAGNACVAAHSTVRALYRSYTGPLYQVCRGASAPGPNSCPGAMTMDIGIVAGGYANAAAQDMFCAGSTCTISTIYDQSPNGNFLKPAPRGGQKPSPDNPANAADLRTTINGHAVYGVWIKPTIGAVSGSGYRAGCTGCGTPVPRGTATGDQPETIYMVTSQNGLVDLCCFDYGNAETTSNDDGNGTMEAVYFGGGVIWGTGSPGGHANGPWVMADLENGLYAGWENNQDQNISGNTALRFPFVTGVVVGDTAAQNMGRGRFAIYGGDATSGTLKQMYDGIRPAKAGYVPMRKQGSIILGIGGDNSDSGGGQWFEGVMASGAATVATVNALQANIVAAGYGK
jgi:non-reducing end alpha-L-arabinofuranosidase